MTKQEAIKYLQQLYPNGGHCWLDEQRIEAIGMAVKALQEEPVSDDLEKEIKNYFEDWYDGGAAEYGGQAVKPNCYFATVEDCKDIARHFANWQKQQDKETIELAEQDLALTWEDIMLIHKCIKDAMNYNLYKMMEGIEGQKEVYEDVLKRFKKMKED